LPFWDQWDDTRTVFCPYFQGKLTLASLLSSHNEHRILLTRVYDLALLLINGQWDNLVQMVANVFLYVGALTGFAWLLAWVLGQRFWPLLALLFMVVLATPITWENTLYGYDSQYYLIVCFALATIWLLGFHKPGTLRWWGGAVAAVASLFAMSAGLLGAAAVVGLLVLRMLVRGPWRARPQSSPVPHGQGPSSEAPPRASFPEPSGPPREDSGETVAGVLRSALPTLAVCFGVIVVGLAMKVEVPFHQVLKAHSLTQFLVFLGKCLAWPWIVLPLFAIFNQFPLLLLAWVYWRDEQARSTAEELVLTLGLWGGLQAVAMAVARGAYVYPQWRYMDSLCFIMVANALSLALLATRHQNRLPLRRYFRPCTGLWVLASSVGIVLLCDRAWQVDIPLRVMHQGQQLFTTRAYLATGERKYLETREKEYLIRWATPSEPQDNPAATIRMLNQPHMRELLPACARDPLPVRPASVTGFWTNVEVPAGPAVPGETAWSSFAPSGVGAAATGRFESQPIPAPKLAYLEFRVAGDMGQPGLSLKLTELKSGKTTEIMPRKPPGGNWESCQVKAPAGEFKIIASDESGSGWLAFQPPREMGWLSRLSERLIAVGKWVFFAGLAVYAPVIALIVAERRRG
jgi:hypothetical protein